MNGNDPLLKFGWDAWFEARAGNDAQPDDRPARVVAVDRDRFVLADGAGVVRAKLAGRFRHKRPSPQDRPCVGDWVRVRTEPGDDFGGIRSVLERRTSIRRKAAGDAVEYQMIAANVDCVFIVQSCHFDFNVNRLERYLVMAIDGGAEPRILLTKTDLVDPATLASRLGEIGRAGIAAPVLPLSNLTGEGLDALARMLLPGRTYCFVGSSGVGKSTILNGLLGRDALGTGEVSGTGEGRHTTVRRELFLLDGGALIIDNPGMREFGILGGEEGLAGGFADIRSYAGRCRFRDCTHTGEPGCGVLGALEDGAIGRDHYENYRKLRRESEHYMASYADRRKKDRDFGRGFKSAMKELKNFKGGSR